MWLKLKVFGFVAMWSPYFLLVLLFILAAYFLYIYKNRNQCEKSEQKRQLYLFTFALFLLYAVKGSPLDLLSHITFYAHMTQMAILYLLIPPLMIAGIPKSLWRKCFTIKIIRAPFLFFIKPLIALFLFNGIFSFYHLPIIFDFVKLNMWIHGAYSILLFLLALFMWWPLIQPLEEFDYLSGIKKIGYIFANGVLLTPACALIIFADTPLYATFFNPHAWSDALKLCVPSSTLSSLNLSGPEMFHSMSPLLDQQLGGVLMKIFQELIYGSMLGIVFFRWYKKEERETVDDRKSIPK